MIEKVPCAPIGVEYLASLPSFCAPVFQDDDSSQAQWIDFWAVEPSGDAFTDYACGYCHGAEALEYARKTSKPEFVDCVIVWMNFYLRSQGKDFGPQEHGFLHRVLREDPQIIDRLLTLIYSAHPSLQN